MPDYWDFEFWNLPPGTDNEKTRIVKVIKKEKYLVFIRDDGKECKYDLSSGEVIGFSGKKVKSLSSQLKDLTTSRMIQICEDENYRNFLDYASDRHSRHRAWWFIEGLDRDLKYEQFFSAGIRDLDYTFNIPFNDIPNGLVKLCREYKLKLSKDLYASYIENVDIFNLYFEIKLDNLSYQLLTDAILYKSRSKRILKEVIDKDDLTMRNENHGEIEVPHRPAPRGMKSFFFTLIEKYNYQPKLLMEYFDRISVVSDYQKPDFFRELYDYANMAQITYENFDKYPKDFKEAHLEVCCKFNGINIKYNESEYKSRNVLDYECEIDGFKFIYPKTTEEIKNEGKNQHNCVASYIDEVLSENCHIMFMRPVDDVEHSYITLEIRSNEIVQAKRKYNDEPSDEEYEIIDKWNEKYKGFVLK